MSEPTWRTEANKLQLSTSTTEIIRIAPDGRIFWRGREVESDGDFRASMLDLLEQLKGVVR